MAFKFFFTISITFFSLSIITVNSANAYLDPGAGSAILQGVLAAIAVVGITAKLYWHKLLKFFGLRKSDTSKKISDSPDI